MFDAFKTPRVGWTGLLVALLVGLNNAYGAPALDSRGKRIWNGQEPLPGKILGHSSDLPAPLTRCANCHARTEPPGLSTSFEAITAPTLNHATLAAMRSRRGGPPFAYDKTGFCRTIQIGIDPQQITLARTMPRFRIDAVQCDALWSYLTSDKEHHNGTPK